jgi:putative DNA primase/helicase
MSAAATRTAALPVDPAGIPRELRDRDQWGCWRAKRRPGKPKPTKVPYRTDGTNASTTDPSTWTTFREALDAYRRGGFDGIGYFFSADDPYVGVDIDHARRDPERLAWALGIVRRFGSYAEWSPSGWGIHIIGRGRLPGGGRNDQKQGLEVYDRERFFTFTGRPVEAAP